LDRVYLHHHTLGVMVSLNLADTWQSGEGSLDGVLTPFAVHPL